MNVEKEKNAKGFNLRRFSSFMNLVKTWVMFIKWDTFVKFGQSQSQNLQLESPSDCTYSAGRWFEYW